MRRWVLVIGIFAAFIIATALVAYNARKNSPVRKVQEEIARLKREGEPTSRQEIAPPVPKHLDGTPLLLKAVEQLDAAQQKIPPNVWGTYNAQVLEAARPALKTFRQALAYPHWRVVDPTNFFIRGGLQPAFGHLRGFAHLLRAEALQRKRKGNVDGALESCQTILKLCRHMDDEPFLIAFLVQRAIFAIGARALWDEVLSDADASATAYQAVLAELSAWDIDRAFVRALKGERVITGILFYDSFRKKLGGCGLFPVSTWFAANQSLTSDFYRQLLPIAQKGVPYDRQKISRLIADFTQKTQGRNTILANLHISSVEDRLFDRVTETHALQRVTEVALS